MERTDFVLQYYALRNVTCECVCIHVLQIDDSKMYIHSWGWIASSCFDGTLSRAVSYSLYGNNSYADPQNKLWEG